MGAEDFKVLICEDDMVARKVLARAVSKEGYTVVTAEDGQQGVEIFDKEAPQIVISDLKMPGLSGLEVLKHVKKSSPHAQFILTTAFGETDTAIEALREGALDYLKKPLDLDLLAVALGRAREKICTYRKSLPLFTLLLAEDDETTRKRLGRVLEKDGWKVVTAADGEEAVRVFQENKFDIVLTDIKMPKKDGIEALSEMRKISDDFEAIVLTGFGDESSAIGAMRSGAMNFLKKPIDLEQLSVVVDKAVEKLFLI